MMSALPEERSGVAWNLAEEFSKQYQVSLISIFDKKDGAKRSILFGRLSYQIIMSH